MSNERTIHIYTDGGARGNPGPAGIGAVGYDENGDVLFELSEYLGEATNNYAEYEAVIRALEAAKKNIGKERIKETDVRVHLDSELVAKQINGAYQIKETTLYPQFIRLHNLTVKDVPNVTFTHVKREQNTKADELANAAMDAGR